VKWAPSFEEAFLWAEERALLEDVTKEQIENITSTFYVAVHTWDDGRRLFVWVRYKELASVAGQLT
jgi:hypothetical protein